MQKQTLRQALFQWLVEVFHFCSYVMSGLVLGGGCSVPAVQFSHGSGVKTSFKLGNVAFQGSVGMADGFDSSCCDH